MPTSALPTALILLGPTASGKTAATLALAKTLPIEIISTDSALIYKGMDIGTAKPDITERAICPHHLIDIITPEQTYSAARFCQDAVQLIHEIIARNHIPVLAGGTMLYFKALRDGLSTLPAADPNLRQRIDEQAEKHGWPFLHKELARIDPTTAAQLAPTDAQRIQRALEIVYLTNRPVAESYAQRENVTLPCTLKTIALFPSERERLHERIATRFNSMLETGLIEEVQTLRRRYTLHPELPSMRCVGYRQVWEYLDRGKDMEQLRFSGIVATRQLAKRQLTWQRQFREQWSELIELDCFRPDLEHAVYETAQRLLAP